MTVAASSYAYFAPPSPRLVAHRGASGRYPENTYEAFRSASDAGAPYLESDVHATADGHLVLHHDAELDRTTNGTGELRAHTLAQLMDLDAGYHFSPDGGSTFPFRDRGVRIPTMADVLDAFPHAKFNLEAKQADPSIVQRMVELIRDRGRVDDVLIACEGDSVRDQLDSAELRGMPRNFSGSEVLEFMQAVYGDQLGDYVPPAPALQIPETYEGVPILTPEFLDAAHAKGLEVHVWTVNAPADMRRFLDMGVDGIMSDFPDTLLEVAATPPS